MKQWVKKLSQQKFGNGLFSQSYQDELLSIVFANIATINERPYCVEFGFSSTQLYGRGANVAKLVLNDGWDCLLLDGDNENHSINLHKVFLTSDNICETFRSHNVPRQPEYVSIDVDSTDLWLFQALLSSEFKPLVYSVEYNSNYAHDKAITFPNDTSERCQQDRGYGASLKSLTILAAEHNYSLLWVVPYLDAFFIRNDLIDDGSSDIVFPYAKWKGCTNVAHHPPLKEKNRTKIFIDYEVYLSSNGDIELSRAAANQACMTYLVGNGDVGTRLARIPGRIAKKLWRMISR